MRMQNEGGKGTSNALQELESQLAAKLPGSYAQFLLNHNGGRPKPRSFRVPSHEERVFDVHYLFGLTRTTETSNVGWHAREYRDFVEAGMLPIGGTETSDLILLRIAGGNRGEVVFWDSMAEDSAHAFYSVAASFEDFLDRLFEGVVRGRSTDDER